MSEFVPTALELTHEQNAHVTTGLMLIEQERTLEVNDIDALKQKANELNGMHDVQRGLEAGIIGSGLQVMADRYGADRLLNALQASGVGSFQGVIEKLAPEKDERESLYAAIKAEPMDVLAERFDQMLGGVDDGNTHVTAMERFRKYEVFSVENKRVMKDVDGNRVLRGRNTRGNTDSATLLLAGDFDSLLTNYPDLGQNFRESHDTLSLLKGIRGIYEAEYTQFATDLEQTKATIEADVAKGEARFVELQTLSDEIYSDEIVRLEQRIAGAGSDAAKEMIQSLLDKKAADITAAREDFESKIKAVRNKTVADLGAESLYWWPVTPPAEPQPTYNDKDVAYQFSPNHGV